MKQYQFTFNVPDDFKPEEFELNVSYPGEQVDIVAEGFQDLSKSFKQFLIEEKIEIKKETVTDHDVVVFKFPQEVLQMPDASTFLSILREEIETTFGCPAIGLVNDIDVLVENADQAIDMLNGMIAKVKVRSAVGNAGKIILPS